MTDLAAPAADPTVRPGLSSRNERLVLSHLRASGPLSKAELARITGLSAQTASVIVRGLEQAGLAQRGDPVRGRVGQPSVPLRVAPRGAFFLGLKIGRRSTELVLTDLAGAVLGRARRAYRYPMPEALLRFLRDAIEDVTETLTPPERTRIAGLGVAMPFDIWEWERVLALPEGTMSAWRDFDAASQLAAVARLPVVIQNDASAACGAELVSRRDPPLRDFLYFYLGTFAGGGLVLGERLHTGRSGNAGALGSMPVAAPGGGVAQLIDVASLSLLEAPMAARGLPTDAIWTAPEGWEVPGDILSRWTDGAAAGLAHAIAASASVVEVEAAVIEGWMPSDLKAALVEATIAALARLDTSGIRPPQVLAGRVGPDARALGAASLPLSDLFLTETGGG